MEPYELIIPVAVVEALSAFCAPCETTKKRTSGYAALTQQPRAVDNRDRLWLVDGHLVACNGIATVAHPLLPDGDKRILGIPAGILGACKVARKVKKGSPVPDLVLRVTPHPTGDSATVEVQVQDKTGTTSDFRLTALCSGCPPYGKRFCGVSRGSRVWFGIGARNLAALAAGVEELGAVGLHFGVPLAPLAGGGWEGVEPSGPREHIQAQMIAVRAVIGGRPKEPLQAGWSGAVAAYMPGGVDGLDRVGALYDPCPIWSGSLSGEDPLPVVCPPEVAPCAEPVASPPPPAVPAPTQNPSLPPVEQPGLMRDLCAAWGKSAELREIVSSALVELRHQGKL